MVKTVFSLAGFALLSGLFLACKSDEEKIKEAEDQVFLVHDEVMPKIDDIMRFRKQLRQRVAAMDSSASTGSASGTLRNDEEKEQALRISRNLTEADSLMNDWMGQYKGDTLAKLKLDDAMRYLDQQKNSITDVKTKVNISIEQARQYLGKK